MHLEEQSIYMQSEEKRKHTRMEKAYASCSSTVGMTQGSGVTHCWLGTPSSNSFDTAAEKLRKIG
jgi:hypothetical protein